MTTRKWTHSITKRSENTELTWMERDSPPRSTEAGVLAETLRMESPTGSSDNVHARLLREGENC